MDNLYNALQSVFTSPNEMDSNFETANVVDGLYAIARSIENLATAVDKHNSHSELSTGKEVKVEIVKPE